MEQHAERVSNKRQKVTRACDKCKSRKRRCNGEVPCSVCLSYGYKCDYTAMYRRGRLVQPLPSTTSETVQSETKSSLGLSRAPSPDRDDEDNKEGDQYAVPEPSSAYAFLKRAWQRFGKESHESTVPEDSGVSIFSYGDKHIQVASLSDGVKVPKNAEALFATYFDFAMPTYRFLHRPTVTKWLCGLQDQASTSSYARQATVWLIMATSSLFDAPNEHVATHSSDQTLHPTHAEQLYHKAQQLLAAETGKTRLESVQARLAACLYLLHTARPNEAWFLFGTTIQLAFALGLHHAQSQSQPSRNSNLDTQVRRRTFWALANLDLYLSIMLGRPPLIHDEDINQPYPEPIDDEELVSDPVSPDAPSKDSVTQASVLHAKLARIVRRAAREQCSKVPRSDQQRIDAATSLNADLAAWRASLPVVLSGAVHPSSLILVFRRQAVVLQLAHAHALMLVNRPALLMDATSSSAAEVHIDACLTAAKTALDLLTNSTADGGSFAAFWFTQYVAFNAVSIVYVCLIQRKRGRLGDSQSRGDEHSLMARAEAMQKHFTDARQMNAPSLRYNAVLEELQRESRRLLELPARSKAFRETVNIGDAVAQAPDQIHLDPSTDKHTIETDSLAWAPTGSDFSFDPDLWLQLDSFPFYIGFEEWMSPA